MSILSTIPFNDYIYYQIALEDEQAEFLTLFTSLKDQICATVDHIGYQFYTGVINRPYTMPRELAEADYERTKKMVFADKPRPFEEIKKEILAYPEDPCSSKYKLERENIELYSDIEFRKAKVKEYMNQRYPSVDTEEIERERLVFSLCKQELHDLYRKEPKYLRRYVEISLWIINYHNKIILDRHKQEWDSLSFLDKVERIFGKHHKCEIVAAVTTVVGYFFSHRSAYQSCPSHI